MLPEMRHLTNGLDQVNSLTLDGRRTSSRSVFLLLTLLQVTSGSM